MKVTSVDLMNSRPLGILQIDVRPSLSDRSDQLELRSSGRQRQRKDGRPPSHGTFSFVGVRLHLDCQGSRLVWVTAVSQ